MPDDASIHWMSVARSAWTRVGRHRIHAYTFTAPHGEQRRPAIVLVHGLGSSRWWLDPARRLVGDYDVHAIDLPGFGRSSHPRWPLTYRQHGAVIARYIEANGLGPCLIASNSASAPIILWAALDHPECADRLALCGPMPDPEGSAIHELLRRWLVNMWREPREHMQLMRRGLDCSPLTYLVMLQRMRRAPIERLLARARLPVRFIGGEADVLAPPLWLDRAACLVPGSDVRLIPGASHTILISDPGPVASLIREFAGATPSEIERACRWLRLLYP